MAATTVPTALTAPSATPIFGILIICALLAIPAPVSSSPDLGLPHADLPDAAAIELGKKLFFDRRLSVNNTLSCAMCHVPEQGFSQNELATPVGLEGRAVKRNSPTLLNVGHLQTLFHDGREFSLENQVWSPLLSQREMGNLSVGLVLEKIGSLDDYADRFNEVFGEISMVTVGAAIAAYERSLNAGGSPFDEWYFKKRAGAVSASVKQGFTLFTSRGCVQCHEIQTEGALFTDQMFHNTGIGYQRSMAGTLPGQKSVRLTDTITIQTDETFEGEVLNDLGRYEVTGDPADRWRYRTPSLRNVAITAPYMHDGSLGTLDDVITFYVNGGIENPGLDPLIKPIELTSDERKQLIDFLQSLTAGNIDALIQSARKTATPTRPDR